MDTLSVSIENPDADDVRDLLQQHFDLMRSTSPAESCHVMEPEKVSNSDVVMYGVRDAGALLAIGAIKPIGDNHAELKSMHTVQHARGLGLARILLDALIGHAKAAGIKQISLETGTASQFQAARALYSQHGFSVCAPFAAYKHDPQSTYMTRAI